MFPIHRCQTPEDRQLLAYELFHEELGKETTDQDFMAKWAQDNICSYLNILTYDLDPYWLGAIRRAVKREVARYRITYADFTRGRSGLNDNFPMSFDDLN